MSMKILKLPGQEPRVETGPVRFGDDWPGLFIRGDNAASFAMALRELARTPEHPIWRAVVDGLISDLESCILTP